MGKYLKQSLAIFFSQPSIVLTLLLLQLVIIILCFDFIITIVTIVVYISHQTIKPVRSKSCILLTQVPRT